MVPWPHLGSSLPGEILLIVLHQHIVNIHLVHLYLELILVNLFMLLKMMAFKYFDCNS